MTNCSTISKICDNLYLGNVGSRNNSKILQEMGIEVVISVMTPDERETLCKELEEPIIEYDIDIEDSSSADIRKAVNKLRVVLGREEGKRCLVHCQLGMSRSPSLIIGYLIYRDKLSFEDALKIVTDARPIVTPNEGFIKQLKGLTFLFDSLIFVVVSIGTIHNKLHQQFTNKLNILF